MFIITKKIDSENISKLCRTCLREDNDKMVCLFVGPSGSSLAAKLRSLSSLEVWQGDGLPEKMCDRCVTRAESALLYREQCRVADKALRQAAMKVPGVTSYTTVSGYRLYQQDQGLISIQNAPKNLKCIECGALFMNYQELRLHNRLHIPILPENNIPPQHMHIVESQNSFLNINSQSTNINLDDASGSITKSSVPYSRTEENPVNNRAACALHCSLCNHTFTNRTQLINHNFTHDTNNTDSVCSEENIEIRENSKSNNQTVIFERSTQHILEKSIPDIHYSSHSSVLGTEQLTSTNSQRNVTVRSRNNSNITKQSFEDFNCVKYKENFHPKRLEEVKNKKYKCEKCAQVFSQKTKLQIHWLLHSDPRPFKCFRCDKAYASKSKLNAHIRLHTKSNVHQCKICNKIFTYPSYLEEHMSTHKLDNQEIEDQKKVLSFDCTICKKQFRFAKILNAHLRLHSGKGLSQCKICDKKFNQKYSLKMHLQTHEAIKLQKCKYCDKSFTSKSNLVEHTRIHTKVKPFECNLCNKKFCQSSHLKSHIASHNSIRQHQCQLCGKRFKLANHLKRHLNSHTGSKTYRCDKCDQIFSQAFSLKRHSKRHDE